MKLLLKLLETGVLHLRPSDLNKYSTCLSYVTLATKQQVVLPLRKTRKILNFLYSWRDSEIIYVHNLEEEH